MLIERKEHLEEDNSIGYIESVFNSGNVLKTTYFIKSNLLYIAFSRGNTYSYGNISPEFYNEFEEADSQGTFFHKRINNNKAYPMRKEFSLYPNEVTDIKNIIESNKKNNDDDE